MKYLVMILFLLAISFFTDSAKAVLWPVEVGQQWVFFSSYTNGNTGISTVNFTSKVTKDSVEYVVTPASEWAIYSTDTKVVGYDNINDESTYFEFIVDSSTPVESITTSLGTFDTAYVYHTKNPYHEVWNYFVQDVGFVYLKEDTFDNDGNVVLTELAELIDVTSRPHYNLTYAILVLQEISGGSTSGTNSADDINNNGKIGLAEALYALQITSGMKPQPFCGDDIVDVQEECDDGNEDNSDACLGNCASASCGDSLTHVGVEQCDDGNDVNSDTCLNTCQLASCGDGFIQAGVEECDDVGESATCDDDCSAPVCGDGNFNASAFEECDDGNLEDGDGCESNCTITKRTVFITSTTYTGNLGGLAGADAKCNNLATAAQLPGTYKAWLSDDTTSPSESFTHHGQFILVDGTIIATSWTDLTDYAILNPINVDENGNTLSSTGVVWSYTKGDGSRYIYGVSCLNWSSDSAEERGTGGYYHLSDYRWSYGGFTSLCSNSQRLYCFEQ